MAFATKTQICQLKTFWKRISCNTAVDMVARKMKHAEEWWMKWTTRYNLELWFDGGRNALTSLAFLMEQWQVLRNKSFLRTSLSLPWRQHNHKRWLSSSMQEQSLFSPSWVGNVEDIGNSITDHRGHFQKSMQQTLGVVRKVANAMLDNTFDDQGRIRDASYHLLRSRESTVEEHLLETCPLFSGNGKVIGGQQQSRNTKKHNVTHQQKDQDYCLWNRGLPMCQACHLIHVTNP